jgi:hypothetical protein
MPHIATAPEILEREFLTLRGRLLDVAAALDRIARGKGIANGDPRLGKLREGLAILERQGTDRAEQLQILFSLPYDPSWRKG